MTTQDDGSEDDTLASPEAGLLGEAVRPVSLSPERREALFQRVLERIHAPAPPGTVTIRADEGEWTEFAPGLHRKVLRLDRKARNVTFLLRMAPGAMAPSHAHSEDEECMVLEGEVVIGDHTARAGDFHLARVGAVHRGFGTRTGCLLLIRAELETPPA